MTYSGRIAYIRNQTLQLTALTGLMVETEKVVFLLQIKQIAKDMAMEMNMGEGLREWTCGPELSQEHIRQCIIAVGVLAKACEALDHLEDYPYRKNIERSIREILNL